MKNLIPAVIVFTLAAVALSIYLMANSMVNSLRNGPSNTSQTSFTQPFTLLGSNGEVITEKTFLGKPTLYFFGFTHCPDICPTTLGAVTNWLNELGPDAKKLNVLFVSIDPARDTPAILNTYISGFHPVIRAATGTDTQLQAATKQFMVYYARVPTKPGENPDDYMMSHSSGILMADKSGTFKGMLDAHDPDPEALAKLRTLLTE
jgi:protein SCO1/2